ncbi:MAG: hypothetical protein FD181_2499 [Prolixibacteraceae bacterium]|nr:MAG: hypothetical protein FD181_2499 [Prolixibacteraceae bacterium]
MKHYSTTLSMTVYCHLDEGDSCKFEEISPRSLSK